MRKLRLWEDKLFVQDSQTCKWQIWLLTPTFLWTLTRTLQELQEWWERPMKSVSWVRRHAEGDAGVKEEDLVWLELGFPGGSVSKESACNAGDLGSIPGLGRSPGEGQGNPFQYSCLESPHGQRSLVGYSPWGRKELDMTGWLSTHTHTQNWVPCRLGRRKMEKRGKGGENRVDSPVFRTPCFQCKGHRFDSWLWN